MSGEDPDYSKRDLWETIEGGEEVEWTAKVQVMNPEEADLDKLGFDPFDVTKVWPRSQFPMHEFGRLVLNKNPENLQLDVESAVLTWQHSPRYRGLTRPTSAVPHVLLPRCPVPSHWFQPAPGPCQLPVYGQVLRDPELRRHDARGCKSR